MIYQSRNKDIIAGIKKDNSTKTGDRIIILSK